MSSTAIPLQQHPAQRALFTPAVILQGFILLEIVAQLGVLVPSLSGARMLTRGGVFAASLALLLLVRGHGTPHPARPAVLATLGVVVISLFHPTTSSTAAGLAQLGMYLAILGPVLWVSRLGPDYDVMRRCLLMLWSFHLLSATLGVLQVYFPGSLQPQISPVILQQGHGYIESLKITTASGARVFRPTGLTDIPGGAASAGFTSAFLGIGFFLTARSRLQSTTAAGSVLIGLMCLYLSQVRAMLVMTLVCAVALAALLVLRRDLKRAVAAGFVLGVAIIAGFQLARSMASAAVTGRVETLTAGSPAEIYQVNRGIFLEYTITDLLPRYPFGAGLGRWGMMAMYFGRNDPALPGLWAEIQWTGWLLDGGVPLIVLYVTAILVTLWTAWRVSRLSAGPHAREISLWGMLLVAYGISVLALTFAYPVFISQAGLEFWLLNAMLYAAAVHAARRREHA